LSIFTKTKAPTSAEVRAEVERVHEAEREQHVEVERRRQALAEARDRAAELAANSRLTGEAPRPQVDIRALELGVQIAEGALGKLTEKRRSLLAQHDEAEQAERRQVIAELRERESALVAEQARHREALERLVGPVATVDVRNGIIAAVRTEPAGVLGEVREQMTQAANRLRDLEQRSPFESVTASSVDALRGKLLGDPMLIAPAGYEAWLQNAAVEVERKRRDAERDHPDAEVTVQFQLTLAWLRDTGEIDQRPAPECRSRVDSTPMTRPRRQREEVPA